MNRSWRRVGLGAVGTGLVGGLLALCLRGSHQMTRPLRLRCDESPDVRGLEWQSLSFPSLDGTSLSAWLIPNPATRAAVIVCHGFGCNKSSMLPYAQFLASRLNVFLLDFRGHGDSGGAWTTIGYYERWDVLAAADELQRLGFGPIGVLGVSMGAAVAVLAGAESNRIAAMVADSPFARLRHAVTQSARHRGYPGAVAPLVATLACRTAAMQLRHPISGCDPIHVVPAIAPRPLFIIHGADDDLIRASEAQSLYAAAGEPRELWLLPGSGHAMAFTDAPEEYRERVTGFFAKWLES